ncbi:hypothetical protein C2G38_2156876, partial [Gigaspora rosea]
DTYSVTDNPYEFKLLLRGTRDGFTKDSFWRLCDKQTHLVVVIKVKGTDEILGGYNPIGWDKPTGVRFYKNCNESFIFSLKNGAIQNSILSRDNFDQRIDCWNSQYSYEKRIRSDNGYSSFSVEEYEIYQIYVAILYKYTNSLKIIDLNYLKQLFMGNLSP